MSAGVFQMPVEELVRLLAKDIAREVVNELRMNDIVPLQQQVRRLEADVPLLEERVITRCRENCPNVNRSETLKVARWDGALNALWKAGVAVIAIMELLVHLGVFKK